MINSRIKMVVTVMAFGMLLPSRPVEAVPAAGIDALVALNLAETQSNFLSDVDTRYDRRYHGDRYPRRSHGYHYYHQGYYYSSPWWIFPQRVRPPEIFDGGYYDYCYYGGGRYGPCQSTFNGHVEWCLARYRSYNPQTDTFVGYDGYRHRCDSPYKW